MSDFKPVIWAGTMISVPAARRVGSTMLGLAASSSCQREPRPRFCCASFQRESPCSTVAVWTASEGAFPAAGGGPIVRATVGGGAVGATFGGAKFGCAASGANLRDAKLGGAILEEVWGKRLGCESIKTGAGRDTDGCAVGAAGATRVSDDGAAGAERRVKGSTRRKGSGLAMDGAGTECGRAGARLGRTGEKLGCGFFFNDTATT